MKRVDARHDEEETGSLGAAGPQATESEDDRALVLLNDFDGGAEREGQRHHHQAKREESEEHGAQPGALGIS